MTDGAAIRSVPADVPAVSLVIPVFRPGATLPELCRRIGQAMAPVDPHYEVVLVDDSGEAESWQMVRGLVETDGHLRALCLGRNYGQHNALLAGIRAARGDVIVTLDDDLQQLPEEIPKLLAALTPEIDVVYGLPMVRQHGAWRNLGAAVLKGILRYVLGSRVAALVSPFRAFRRHLRRGFAHYRGADIMIDVLLSWSTSRYAAVSVRHQPRAHGRSGYTLGKLLRLGLTMIVGFSALPLRLSSVMGIAMAFFGLFLLAYVLLRYVMSDTHIPGFTFLASIVAIFSGAQIMALGIVGEYLARVHFRAMARPTYVVREEIPATLSPGDPADD